MPLRGSCGLGVQAWGTHPGTLAQFCAFRYWVLFRIALRPECALHAHTGLSTPKLALLFIPKGQFTPGGVFRPPATPLLLV